MISLSLAVLGIVVGGAGLYFGLTANQRLGSVNESVEAGTSSAVRLEKQIETLNTQIAELSAMAKEDSDALSRVRTYTNTNERNIKQLASDLKANREQIIKLTEQVVELANRSVQAAPAPTVSASVESTADTGSGSSGGATPGGTYTIESGDYFAKIATKLGVSLQALLDANPDVDPRRLRIGQVINLPSN